MKPDNDKYGTWINTPKGRMVDRRKWKRFKLMGKVKVE